MKQILSRVEAIVETNIRFEIYVRTRYPEQRAMTYLFVKEDISKLMLKVIRRFGVKVGKVAI